jgi:hypothetical protein
VHRPANHPSYRSDVEAGIGDSTVARTIAVLTSVAFVLHYRYGATALDLAAFMPASPLRHYGFPIFANAFLVTGPLSLLLLLFVLVFGVAPLERRIGSGWTWALFFWGHLVGVVVQLLAGPAHLATYRSWGPNAGILALLVASAALARHFRRHRDDDFHVDAAPAPRGATLWLVLYVGGTLATLTLYRAEAVGLAGEASLAGMLVGFVGAWSYRAGSALARLFALATPLARTAIVLYVGVAATAERKRLVEPFRSATKPAPRVTAAGLEALPRAEPARAPSTANQKLERFLDAEVGARELVFAAIDPADHTFAFAGGALWVSGRWVPAAMLWDEEGFSAVADGVTVRVRKPSRLDGHVVVLVNGSPIDAWPGARVSAPRLRALAQAPPRRTQAVVQGAR